MATTPFRIVSWQPNEILTHSKLNQFSDNQQWLYDNMPRARYMFTGGARRNEGVKILGGYCLIPATSEAESNQTVNFGEFFTPGCKPIITTGTLSIQRRMHITYDGIGTFMPDHRGFIIHVRTDAAYEKNNVISRNMYVGWQALGY